MLSAPVTAIDVTPQSLRWCRLSFSVTTARSLVHRPLVWAARHWFGQFPLPSSSVVTQAGVLGGELPQGEYIYTLSVVTAPGADHWLTQAQDNLLWSKFPHPKWRAEEIKIKIWAQAWCNSNVFILLSELPWLAAQSLDNFPTHFVSLSISALSHYSSLIPDHVLPIRRLSTDVQKVQTNQCRYQRR